MNSQTRTYKMDARRAAAAATRERILDVARQAFLEGWYDEVTIGGIAKDAGVSGQTVLNHFGDKESLLMAATQRFDTDVRVLDGLDTPVSESDTLVILPAMAGGAATPGSSPSPR